mgnify:CR=1 FL=1
MSFENLRKNRNNISKLVEEANQQLIKLVMVILKSVSYHKKMVMNYRGFVIGIMDLKDQPVYGTSKNH